MDDRRHFAYHCQYAYLNDTLRLYLKSLSFTTLPAEVFPESRGDLDADLRPNLWFFFRTLIREVGVNSTFFISIDNSMNFQGLRFH